MDMVGDMATVPADDNATSRQPKLIGTFIYTSPLPSEYENDT